MPYPESGILYPYSPLQPDDEVHTVTRVGADEDGTKSAMHHEVVIDREGLCIENIRSIKGADGSPRVVFPIAVAIEELQNGIGSGVILVCHEQIGGAGWLVDIRHRDGQ